MKPEIFLTGFCLYTFCYLEAITISSPASRLELRDMPQMPSHCYWLYVTVFFHCGIRVSQKHYVQYAKGPSVNLQGCDVDVVCAYQDAVRKMGVWWMSITHGWTSKSFSWVRAMVSWSEHPDKLAYSNTAKTSPQTTFQTTTSAVSTSFVSWVITLTLTLSIMLLKWFFTTSCSDTISPTLALLHTDFSNT